MKKLLIVFLLLSSLSGAKAGSVYICTGPQSKRYHKTAKCRGLGNCSTEVIEVSLEKAKELGRRPCKICYEKR